MNKLNHWKKLGVPSPSTKYQLTSICKFFAKKWTLHDAKKEEYRMFEGERFYGTFNGSQNILVFRDDFHLLRSIINTYLTFIFEYQLWNNENTKESCNATYLRTFSKSK